jgi:hypothetical protein
MTSSDLNYSIFHFFGDNKFIEFIKIILKFVFLLEPCMDSFPNKIEEYHKALEEICTSIPELIFEFGEPSYIQSIMQIIINIFLKNLDEIIANVDTKMLYDDKAINMVHTICLKLGGVLYEEILIDPSSTLGQKCISCRQALLPQMKLFVTSTVEACFSINYTVRINNLLADIVQTFLCLDQEGHTIMTGVREYLISTICRDQEDRQTVCDACDK